MLLVLLYLVLAALLVLGLCAFTPTFNAIACLVMALATGILALFHWLTEVRWLFRKSRPGEVSPSRPTQTRDKKIVPRRP